MTTPRSKHRPNNFTRGIWCAVEIIVLSSNDSEYWDTCEEILRSTQMKREECEKCLRISGVDRSLFKEMLDKVFPKKA